MVTMWDEEFGYYKERSDVLLKIQESEQRNKTDAIEFANEVYGILEQYRKENYR